MGEYVRPTRGPNCDQSRSPSKDVLPSSANSSAPGIPVVGFRSEVLKLAQLPFFSVHGPVCSQRRP